MGRRPGTAFSPAMVRELGLFFLAWIVMNPGRISAHGRAWRAFEAFVRRGASKWGHSGEDWERP